MASRVAAVVFLALVCAACTSAVEPGDATTSAVARATSSSSGASDVTGFPGPGEAWDLVVMTNSIGWRVAEPYAELASEALGVPVVAHDAAIDRLAASQALLHLRDIAYPGLSEMVREAEIIVVYAGPEPDDDWWDACGYFGPDPGLPSHEFTQSDWAAYRSQLDALFAEIWRLRGDAPTVIRAIDMPVGMVGTWDEPGKREMCLEGWTVLNGVTGETAEAHDVALVSLFDIFNGTAHDEDPYEKGWILEDHVHPTEAGTEAIVKALAAAGFELTQHP